MSGILSIWKALSGTMNSFFNIGGTSTSTTAVRLKVETVSGNNGVACRKSDDSAYINCRVADPVNLQDAVTKNYAVQNTGAAGTAANRPSATGSGKIYFCTDIPVIYVDDPTTVAWLQFGSAGYMPAPGAIGGWTVCAPAGALGAGNIGDSILATTQGGVTMNALLAPIPALSPLLAGSFSVDAVHNHLSASGKNGTEVGAAVANGTTVGTSTIYLAARYVDEGNSQEGFVADDYTLGTSTRSVLRFTDSTVGGSSRLYTRTLSDGTSLFFQYSTDGVDWITIYGGALPAGITQYGLAVGNNANNTTCVGALWQGIRVQAPKQVAISGGSTVNPTTVSITTSSAHGLLTGHCITIRGVTWSGGTAPNGFYDWDGDTFGGAAKSVIVTSPTTFTVPFATAGTWASGGVVTSLTK